MRALLVVLAALSGACSQCTPASLPPPTIDGGSLHAYLCPVADGGPSWGCQDGLTTPVGSCAAFGCVPVGP